MVFSPPLHQSRRLQSLGVGLLLPPWTNKRLNQRDIYLSLSRSVCLSLSLALPQHERERETEEGCSEHPLKVSPVFEGFGVRIGDVLYQYLVMKSVSTKFREGPTQLAD